RLENVEGVSKLLTEAGIENRISDDRGYKQVSRREFSYVQKKNASGNQPAVWVINSDDYKTAREMLHSMGLVDATSSTPSYVPEALQFKQTATRDPQSRVKRIKIGLLLAIGALLA